MTLPGFEPPASCTRDGCLNHTASGGSERGVKVEFAFPLSVLGNEITLADCVALKAYHSLASCGCGQFVCLLVGCLTSQQHASVSQGRICTDNFTCCHTEIEAADQTFHLTQSQYTDTGPTSPSADPITPGRLAG